MSCRYALRRGSPTGISRPQRFEKMGAGPEAGPVKMYELDLLNMPGPIHDMPMEKSSHGDAQHVPVLTPFPARRVGETKSGLAGAEKVAPLLHIHRRGEPLAVAMGDVLRVASRSSTRDFLGGAACLAIWAILWLLMVFTVAAPRFERQELGPRKPVIPESTALVGAPRSCQAGMIELEGRCVLGEEVEVRPPPGWRRP